MESPFLLVLVSAVVAAGIAYRYRRTVERRLAMGSLAVAQGLDFSIDDPFDTLGEPFSLLGEGDGRGVENVLWGTWHGTELRAFDYWYYEESTDSDGHRSRSYSRFDCVIGALDARCPRLRIANENVLTRLADVLTFDDIAFESDEFNRLFDVRCDDRRFATAFCDARMLEWLLRHGDGYSFEVVGNRFLCWRRRIPPAEMVHLLGTAKAFGGQVPHVVSSLYPNG